MFEDTTLREGGFDRDLFTLTQIQHLMRVEFNRAERYQYPIACMVVAVDRLGHLRDLYGYAAKESVLKRIVELLEAETRSSDYLGRLADDRLLAVVPHTDEPGAEVMSGRLLKAARELDLKIEGQPVEVTLSIGASHNQGGKTLFFDALLGSAEDAVAVASGRGGDRYLMLAPGTPPPAV